MRAPVETQRQDPNCYRPQLGRCGCWTEACRCGLCAGAPHSGSCSLGMGGSSSRGRGVGRAQATLAATATRTGPRSASHLLALGETGPRPRGTRTPAGHMRRPWPNALPAWAVRSGGGSRTVPHITASHVSPGRGPGQRGRHGRGKAHGHQRQPSPGPPPGTCTVGPRCGLGTGKDADNQRGPSLA